MALLPIEPVHFVTELEDVTFRVGQPLNLQVTFTGNKHVRVSWTKDGKAIWASYKYNVKMAPGCCVLEVLTSDRQEAAGRHSCQISCAGTSAVCHANVTLGNRCITGASR